MVLFGYAIEILNFIFETGCLNFFFSLDIEWNEPIYSSNLKGFEMKFNGHSPLKYISIAF